MRTPSPSSRSLDALGDRTRRAILELIGSEERSVQEIADQLPVSRPAVSRHLSVLSGAGLVTGRAEGTRRLYRLDPAGADAVRAYLEALWDNAGARFRIAAANLSETPPESGP